MWILKKIISGYLYFNSNWKKTTDDKNQFWRAEYSYTANKFSFMNDIIWITVLQERT